MADIGSMGNPAFTYNLFTTLGGFGLLAWWIKRLLSKNEELLEVREKEKKEAIEKEAKAAKELLQTWQKSIVDNIIGWQEGAKERTASVCAKLDIIIKDVERKVEVHECERIHKSLEVRGSKIIDDFEKKINKIEEKVFYT
jgi:hypothetical protein